MYLLQNKSIKNLKKLNYNSVKEYKDTFGKINSEKA